jgi:hypothetical protein
MSKMILFTNVEGRVSIELGIVGYEFPFDTADNWCLLDTKVTQGSRIFHCVDPAVETSELISMRDWFHCLLSRTLPQWGRLWFTEPCLSFEFLSRKDDVVRVGVGLQAEMRPNFRLNQFGRRSQKWNIVCELHNDDLRSIVAELTSSMQKFPIRKYSPERAT